MSNIEGDGRRRPRRVHDDAVTRERGAEANAATLESRPQRKGDLALVRARCTHPAIPTKCWISRHLLRSPLYLRHPYIPNMPSQALIAEALTAMLD